MNTEDFWKNHVEPAAKAAFIAGVEHGYAAGEISGYQKGLEVGKSVGFVAGLNALTPAISDGLRHGSPACGSAMQSLKSLMPDYVTDEDYAVELAREFDNQ